MSSVTPVTRFPAGARTIMGYSAGSRKYDVITPSILSSPTDGMNSWVAMNRWSSGRTTSIGVFGGQSSTRMGDASPAAQSTSRATSWCARLRTQVWYFGFRVVRVGKPANQTTRPPYRSSETIAG